MSELNIGQIYHTSHCGSTLMAALLANSTFVYSEPPWAYDLLMNQPTNLINKSNVDNTIIIKFSSFYCNFSNNLPGPKLFLYRKLAHHLFKIKTSNYIDTIISTKYDKHLEHAHSSLSKYTPESNLERIAFIWLNNIQTIRDSKDILWIESNNFFADKKNTMNTVCDYFKVDRIKNFEISNIYVKSLNLIGNEFPINDIHIPNLGEIKSTYPSFGIVETDLAILDDQIKSIVDHIETIFPELNEYLK